MENRVFFLCFVLFKPISQSVKHIYMALSYLFVNLQRVWSNRSVCRYDLQDVCWRHVQILYHIHHLPTGTSTR